MADNVEDVVTPEPVAPEWAPEDVAAAKVWGWKAPDEWTGDKPAGYIDDPKRFVERYENTRPVKALQETIAKQAADFEERTRKIEAMSTKALEAVQAQHEAERNRLTGQQRAAVETGDVAEYDKLATQIAAIKPVEAPKEIPKGPDPFIVDYVAKNDWAKDPVLFDFAARAIDLGGMANKPVAQQVAYAEAKVREMFPHKFTPAAVPNRVDGGGLGGGKRDAFAALPSEARSTFNKFVAKGLFKDDAAGRARYAEDYNAA